MHNPDLLVLGATGRIGGILRRFWSGDPAHAPVLWQARGADAGPGWCLLDPLEEPAALAAAARGRTAILCLAGVVPGRGGDLRDNSALARAAIRAGSETGARVILCSTAAVYGARGGLLSEDTPAEPVSDYGRAKAEMEAAGAELGARLGVPVTALRIGNIAGADAILGGWHAGFQLDRFADGRTPRRSYVGPATLARVLAGLCAAPELPQTLNVAAPGVVEMGGLLDAAGLAWQPRRPAPGAIPQVQLSTALLEGFTSFAEADKSPEGMVAEWRLLTSEAPE